MSDRVALIVGGTQASGAAIATRFAQHGATVIIAGRNSTAGCGVAATIASAGGKATFSKLDVSDESNVESVVSAIEYEFGRLDVVVNNAAAVDQIREGQESAVTTCPTRVFENILRVGVLGPFWLFKYAIPGMLDRDGGVFVSVSSVAATRASRGIPAYTSSKAALEALSRQVCADYGPRGIRSNIIRLGNMRVPGNAYRYEANPAREAAEIATTMTRRLGRPDDLASAAFFLAEPANDYLNGTVLTLDGGSTVLSGTAQRSGLGPTARGGLPTEG